MARVNLDRLRGKKKKRKVPPPVTVAGTTVAAGELAAFDIPVARLTAGTMVSMPVRVVHGSKPGPRIWLSAAIHGDELNGIEIIRRVLMDLDPKALAGTVVAVPIVNVFGFINESRYLPDRRDLNRSFPGSPRGSLASRIAHLFLQEIVEGCDVGIDLHTGSHFRTNLPQIRADLDDPETLRLSRAFRAPLSLHARLRDHSLRATAMSRGARVLLYEAGEALRFDEESIRVGVRGVLATLRTLRMLDIPRPEAKRPRESRESRWVRAARGGIFHPEVGLGDRVKDGQVLGRVMDATGGKSYVSRSPYPGMVIGMTLKPLVNKGDAVIHVAALEPRAT